MKDAALLKLAEWIVEAGLAGKNELDLVQEFSKRAVEAGVPLSRGLVGIDTLHPVLEGRIFAWRRVEADARQSDYTRGNPDGEKWLRSPFYHLMTSGESVLRRAARRALQRRRVPDPRRIAGPGLDRLRRDGQPLRRRCQDR